PLKTTTQGVTGSGETEITTTKIPKTTKIKTTTSSSKTVSESSDVKCVEPDGLFSHPSDCHLFLHCVGNRPYVKQCPQNTFFNNNIKVCDHMANAPDTCK
ncbi:unnamed protein product, partial [Cercopithifilaria johnstoni]